MLRQFRKRPSRALLALSLWTLCGGLTGCSDAGGPGDIHKRRTVATGDGRARPGVTSRERFESGARLRAEAQATPSSASGGNASGFAWDIPEGWTSVPPRSNLRIADFSIDAAPGVECYAVAMGGDGGGLVANVNRWRDQVGQPPISAEAVAALPMHPLSLRPAPFVEVEGDYRNMEAAVVSGAKLVGLIHTMPGFTLFVKMTGPTDLVDAELPRFLALCASLDITPPSSDSGAAPSGNSGPQGPADGGLNWTAPETWSKTAPKTMRLVNYDAGDGVECYISVLGGTGGGVLGNLNRWLKQIGKPEIGADGVANLTHIPILGQQAPLVDGTGDFKGMNGEDAAAQGLMATIVLLPDKAVTVKLIGPAGAVAERRDAFVNFAASIVEGI
ncbi:MAG: hypothetical protein ACI9HE_002320 [Planctomycetota bacterium]|jgi:hypothetical protein